MERSNLYWRVLANDTFGAKPNRAAEVPAIPLAQILKKDRRLTCISISLLIDRKTKARQLKKQPIHGEFSFFNHSRQT
ncbi:TPA: hypothetical protein ACS72K_002019 [Providencia alcalifaciens]